MADFYNNYVIIFLFKETKNIYLIYNNLPYNKRCTRFHLDSVWRTEAATNIGVYIFYEDVSVNIKYANTEQYLR